MKAIISRNKEGHYFISADGGEGLYADGKTEDEVRQVFKENFEDAVDFATERDGKKPNWANEEITFVYSISAFLQAFPFINVSKFAEECGISPSLMRRFKQGEVTPSKASIERITNGPTYIREALDKISFQ